jgi:PAS domain S-box-containing protein
MLASMLAFRDGNFSVRLPSDWDGIDGQIAAAFNQAISYEDRLSHEVERLGRTVGREGRLKQRMSVPGATAGWAAKVDCFNTLMDDLVRPTTEISRTIGAVARGDLGQSIELEVDGRPLKGEFLRSAELVNKMIEQLAVFTSEVTRVAREVGTEGKLGGQAQVKRVSGVWKELTDSVNQMAGNLTAQVRNIAEVTIAVANGDLSKKITVDVRGEILQLKEAINTMVDQLRSFASEVTRVAREVGTDGRLGGQAVVPGVAGTWKDLTDSVNAMATNLTAQVRNIAQVTTAVARGDLSRKITVDVRGEILELKETINTMVDQLNSFSSEVTRVAREVGTEGKLGGQAAVPGVAGTWKDLTESVNFMASNLTGQVRNIAEVTTAVATGDLSRKITVDVRGEILQLKETVNTMVDQLNGFASEVTRVAREVGTEGKLGGQAQVPGVAGTWKDLTDNVNFMASNLTDQVRNIADVATAIARGDLSRKITVDVNGEILQLKETVNTMVDQLNGFASEVTRVAREVGTDGKLGGQAAVPGVAGTWKDLTDNVNFMASNLTDQVRGIVKVVTAVANGDLNQRLTMQAKGEVAALADTINNMTDTLATFAVQVTNVAREVGVEGRLGGQANVPGAAGTWKDLTANVNLLAANLTSQVRAIAEVATAVTCGDLTRSIQVETRGEVADLKDNINTMISNLRETTKRNREQDWLKTNLAKFAGMFQGQRDLSTVGRMLLSELCPLVGAHHGTLYHLGATEANRELRLLSSYAHTGRSIETIQLGEGLTGQCAMEKKRILLNDVPPQFIAISSSLGEAPHVSIVVLPILFEGATKAVIELATVHRFTDGNLAFLDQLTVSIGAVFHTIEATMRTESLLEQSQRLTVQLQSRQSELQRTLAAVVESSDDAILSKDLNGIIATFNQRAERLYGYRGEEVVGKPVTILIPPDRQHEAPEILARIRRGGRIEQYETVRRRKDGTLVDISLTVSPVKDDQGGIGGASEIARDITERNLSEARLRDSERQLQELIAAIPAAIYTTDAQGKITYFNQAVAELAGRSPTIGSDEWCVTWRLYHPNGTPLPYDQCPMAIALKENRAIRNAEIMAERPDGTRVPFIPYPTPLRDSAGKIIGAINMLVDVSERKHAETQQRVLLNELVHRVKNNLQMLLMLLEAGARRAESSEARDVLKEASGRVMAMAAVQRVLYTMPDAMRFNAREFLNIVCETAKQTFPQELDIDYYADAIQLSNDAAMPLALIANELLTNAVKYGVNEWAARTIRVRLGREDDSFLFYVEDDGPGFDLQLVQQRSSGLRLVQGLARQLGGKFEVTRTPATKCSVRFQ